MSGGNCAGVSVEKLRCTGYQRLRLLPARRFRTTATASLASNELFWATFRNSVFLRKFIKTTTAPPLMMMGSIYRFLSASMTAEHLALLCGCSLVLRQLRGALKPSRFRRQYCVSPSRREIFQIVDLHGVLLLGDYARRPARNCSISSVVSIAHRFVFFAGSAPSSRRRTASGREGASFCLAIQASRRASISGLKRTITGAPSPIAGRPRVFLVSVIDCFMIYLISEKRAERKLELPPGPNPRQRGDSMARAEKHTIKPAPQETPDNLANAIDDSNERLARLGIVGLSARRHGGRHGRLTTTN